jgi:hypothetical protein|eukprot:COSAG03_NODE_253_length_9917_cov_116.496944_7_plen_78_part_00
MAEAQGKDGEEEADGVDSRATAQTLAVCYTRLAHMVQYLFRQMVLLSPQRFIETSSSVSTAEDHDSMSPDRSCSGIS